MYIENLREEDNLSIKDKTAEFILFPKCPLFGGSTVLHKNAIVVLINTSDNLILGRVIRIIIQGQFHHTSVTVAFNTKNNGDDL